MADSTPKSYHTDPTLWLYTSLTAGSSHIITATSRLETILKANKVPFKALDVATDEKARMLWGRRAGKRKLPGLVRMGMVVGDIEEVEEWNEYGEVKQNLLDPSSQASTSTPTPSTTNTPSKPPATSTQSSTLSQAATQFPQPLNTTQPAPSASSTTPSNTSLPLTTAMRQASLEAAAKANAGKAHAASKAGLYAKAATIMPGSGVSGEEFEALSKIENSTAAGTLPPVGTTEASEFGKQGIGGKSKAERAGVTFKGDDRAKVEAAGVPPGAGVPETTHRGSIVTAATPEEIKAVAERSKIAEQPEEEAAAEAENKTTEKGSGEASTEEAPTKAGAKTANKESGGTKTEDATAATDEAEDLPGTTTQEQDAADGDKAGESVAD